MGETAETWNPANVGRADGPAWLDACWEWTLRRRALVLDELAYRHQTAGRSPEAREPWEAWVAARGRVASLWVRAPELPSPEYREEMDPLTTNLGELRRRVDRLESAQT